MSDIVYLYKDATQGWTTCGKDFAEWAEEHDLPVKRVDMDEVPEIETQDRFVEK